MALSAAVLGSLIDANLVSAGAMGSNRTVFANKVAEGIVNGIVGKTFSTLDTGVGTGGTGIGTGITGIDSSSMETVALAAMSSQGSNASALMNAIMVAVVQHLINATLTTVNPAVGNGTGIVVIGSIGVSKPDMSSQIQTALSGAGANGSNMPNLADAIAEGITSNIISAGTGTVVISGGSVVPPSGGTGTGTIS